MGEAQPGSTQDIQPSTFQPRPITVRSAVALAPSCIREYGIVFALTLFVAVILLVDTPVATQKTTDFFYNYYAIGKLVITGHGDRIYDASVVGHLQRALVAPLRVPRHVLPNVYPPVVGVSFAPLAALPYPVAYILWLLLNCGLLTWSIRAWERYMGISRSGRIVWRALILCSLPVVVALLQGQLSIVLLASLSACFFSYAAANEVPAGIFLALTLAKPQFTFPILLVFALRRGWRVLGAFLVAAAVLFLFPLPFAGIGVDVSFIRSLIDSTGLGTNTVWGAPSGNRGFTGFFQLLLPSPASTVASSAADVLALAALAVASVRTRSFSLAFGLGVVVATLIAPHVLIHDLSLLVIPAAIMITLFGDRRREAIAVLLAGYVAILVGFTVATRTPLQLATPTMLVWGLWLWWRAVLPGSAEPRSRAGTQIPLPALPESRGNCCAESGPGSKGVR